MQRGSDALHLALFCVSGTVQTYGSAKLIEIEEKKYRQIIIFGILVLRRLLIRTVGGNRGWFKPHIKYLIPKAGNKMKMIRKQL